MEGSEADSQEIGRMSFEKNSRHCTANSAKTEKQEVCGLWANLKYW
jgi:hypothetical protein